MEKYKTKIETRQHLTEETGQRYKNIGTHKTTLENKFHTTHTLYIYAGMVLDRYMPGKKNKNS